jgi:glycosyltransferase involved in cell wall biosynthesis
MKILISCLSFKSYTGSELYVYELAKELAKEHDVDIISNIGGDLVDRIAQFGVNCYDIKSPPNYFLGDGERKFIVNGETKIAEKNKFYKTSNETEYDLMLLNHPAISRVLLDLYDAPAINIVHSEVLPQYEHPIQHPKVKGYIAIRSKIKEYLIKEWGIESDKISVIYNPIDNVRFNRSDCTKGDYILFVGSYDYLRTNTISDLIKYSKEKGKELWLVGRDYPNFVEPWVKTFEPIWDIEKYVKGACEVASVLLGRTVFEGWLCGKVARIYDINEKGDINCVENKKPVVGLEKVFPENVVKEILNYDIFN